MALRAAGVIRNEIARLALPMPLEVLVLRAINAEGADGCHERLVYAWEIAIQISASACWAVCRHLGLRSDALDAIRAKLARPSFGHWLELLRASRALLAGKKEAAAIALAPLLDGLEKKYEENPAFVVLAERMRALPKKPIKIGGRTVAALLDALPAYRNETRGHGEPDTEFRDGSIEALAGGLIAFANEAPLLGDYRIGVVHRVERATDATSSVELAMMERTLSAIERLDGLDPKMAEGLQPARAYLRGRDDSFVPLFPAAAAVRGDDGWALGWMKQQVRMPTVSFESSIAGAFSLAVEREELDSLFKSDDSKSGDAEVHASEETLALDPWRGLLAYGEEHKELFFGRSAEIVSVASRLREKGVVLLCGASGSGKSSLMRAGLLPRLRATAHERGAELSPCVFFPGEHPLEALRAELVRLAPSDVVEATRWSKLVDEMVPADGRSKSDALVHLARGLAATGRHLALLVDQLEEAATLCTDVGERQEFLDLICTLAREATTASAVVVGTVRADKIAALLEHEGARDLFRKALEPVATLGRDALLEVVTGPLRGRRVAIEAGLAERIAADVGDEPGGLALVSQVLASLWDERGRYGDRLTTTAYDALGGVSGVLGSQAEQARLSSNAPAGKLDAILVQLAQRGDDGSFTRRRANVAALAESIEMSPAELDAMIEPFVKRRLLVVGEGTVEVAHEMLLRGWVTLRELLEKESAVTELRQRIEHAASAWEGARERGEGGELWTDATSNLRRAEELLAEKRIPLSKREVAFIEASRRSVQRAVRVKRAGVGAVGVLFVAAIALAWVALVAKQSAEASFREARHSVEMARDAFVTQAASPNADWAGRSDAMMSALRAIELERRLGSKPTRFVLNGLSAAVTQGRSLTDGYVLEGGAVLLPPDLIAVFAERDSSLGTLRIYRASTREVVHELDGVRGYLGANGSRLWLAFDGRHDEIFDARTGERKAVRAVEWAHAAGDDRWIAPLAQPTEAEKLARLGLFDANGQLLTTVKVDATAFTEPLQLVKASPKAHRIALVSTGDCPACARALVDSTDGRVVSVLPSASAAEFSEDGSALFVLRADGVVQRRDPATGDVIQTLKASEGNVLYAGPTGKSLLVARPAEKTIVIVDDMKAAGEVRVDDASADRGWVDDDTFFNCPKCSLYSAKKKTNETWGFLWGRNAVSLTEPCALLVSGGGLFTRVTCDGRESDRGASDTLLDEYRMRARMAGDALVADSAHEGSSSVKVWPRGWPSVATVVAPPNLFGTAVDGDARRIWTHAHNDAVLVTDHDGKLLWKFPNEMRTLGKHGELGAGFANREVVVFDGPGNKKLYTIPESALPAHAKEVSLDVGGRTLVVVGDEEAFTFDAATGKPTGGSFAARAGAFILHAGDGCRFAVDDHVTLSAWDACTKKRIFEVTPGRESTLKISADGKRALVGGEKLAMKVLDMTTGAEIATIPGDARYRMDISGDGSRVVARGDGGRVCVWDVATPTRSTCLHGSNRMGAVAISRDGKRVLVSDDAGTRIFDVVGNAFLVDTIQGYPGRPAFLGEDRVVIMRDDHFVVWRLAEADLMRAACWHAHFRKDYSDVEFVCRSWVDEVKSSLR